MLSDYEQDRQDNIGRNQAEMVRLGLATVKPQTSVHLVATPVKKKRAIRGKGKKLIVKQPVRQWSLGYSRSP